MADTKQPDSDQIKAKSNKGKPTFALINPKIKLPNQFRNKATFHNRNLGGHR
jgi:hypothetical protein